MSRGVRWVFGGSVILVALAGCGRSFLSYEVRAPWRKDAEVACLNSGTVKEGTGVVRISPIDGPGMCGADFPLKVAALGESAAMGYGEELRPPGSIPGANPGASRPAAEPRWPIQQQPYNAPVAQPRYAPPQQAGRADVDRSAKYAGRRPARQCATGLSAARRAAVEPARTRGMAARAAATELSGTAKLSAAADLSATTGSRRRRTTRHRSRPINSRRRAARRRMRRATMTICRHMRVLAQRLRRSRRNARGPCLRSGRSVSRSWRPCRWR